MEPSNHTSEHPPLKSAAGIEESTLLARIWELLHQVIDPEMKINIVDLGLVYQISLREDEPTPPEKKGIFQKIFSKKPVVPQQEPGKKVIIEMTLTSPSCPMGPHIFSCIYRTIEFLKGVSSVDISLVWEPPWSQEKISEAGKMELGLL